MSDLAENNDNLRALDQFAKFLENSIRFFNQIHQAFDPMK